MSKSEKDRKKTVSQQQKEEILQVKSKEKKIVKKVILIVLIAALVCVVLWGVVSLLENQAYEQEYTQVEQVEEIYPTINPFPADFDKDLSGYNPDIMYVFLDGNAFSIRNIPEDERNEGQKFFLEYFDVLKKGDSGKYGSLFTKSYKKDPKGFEKDFTRQFPPQQLYDIRVQELMRTTDTRESYTYEGKKCFFGYYLVSYKIHENDGYFRRDLYAEQIERPLIFELVTFDKDTPNEKTYIKNMYTESSIQKTQSK